MTWMNTHSNIPFDIMDLEHSAVCIEDIAHALGNLCRYQGHSKFFYSVAEHSITVSKILPDHLKLAGLLHDASEAYIGDMIRPHKQMFPDYQALEKRIEAKIFEAFGINLGPLDWDSIKRADDIVLFHEKKILFPNSTLDWKLPEVELDKRIKVRGFWPHIAGTHFKDYFFQLMWSRDEHKKP